MVHLLPTDVLGQILDFFIPSCRAEADAYSIVAMQINRPFKRLVEARKPSWKKFYVVRNKVFLGLMLSTRTGLDWCVSQGYKREVKSTFDIIVQTGNLELLQYAAKTLQPVIHGWCIFALRAAIQYKNLEMVKWITKEAGVVYDEQIPGCALKGGDIKIVEWMMNNGYEFSYNHFIDNVSYKGNTLELIQWCVEVMGITGGLKIPLFYMHDQESLKIFKWLRDEQEAVIEEIHLRHSLNLTVEMLGQIPASFSRAVMDHVLLTDNLPVFRALVRQDGGGETAVKEAARSNAVAILEWLVGRPDWNSDHILHSLRVNSWHSLEMIKFLSRRGVKIDYLARLLSITPCFKTFEYFKWLHAKCEAEIRPPRTVKYQKAVSEFSEHPEILEWMIEHGYYQGEKDLEYYLATHGNIEMLDWLAKNKGCVFDWPVAYHAVQGRQLHTVMWLFENGCQLDERVFESMRFSLDILKWAYTAGVVSKFSNQTYNNAIIYGSVKLISWLKGKCKPPSPASDSE